VNFEGMSAAEAADEIARIYSEKGTQRKEILTAIQHFSNRNLVAARRYAYLVEYKWKYEGTSINTMLELAEDAFPDA